MDILHLGYSKYQLYKNNKAGIKQSYNESM